LLLLLFVVHFHTVEGLSYTIDANAEECFYEEVPAGTRLGLSYQVTEGGALDIDCVIKGPDDSELFKMDRSSSAHYTFSASTQGVYKFCFGNTFSTVTRKQIGFIVTVGETNTQELAKAEHLSVLENSIMQVSEGLASIQSEQAYMRARERGHRSTTESTNERVLYWAVFEAIVLLCMSFGQIFYIKRSFETKTKV